MLTTLLNPFAYTAAKNNGVGRDAAAAGQISDLATSRNVTSHFRDADGDMFNPNSYSLMSASYRNSGVNYVKGAAGGWH
eukprot:CAMPEP_0114555840 /NCGR_PEP_ID=MMETSP0114-20121206/8965_1 /TAXON_ID=31324 /ORGANISM="Goniomonas sp, Strain m" /LENGTH=78 /DNA_ID=CAMNT_0001740995 /DNA_START=14 /DNA_END=250 /DNA_ORIENTATION=+